MKLIANNIELDLSENTYTEFVQTSSVFSPLKGDYSFPFELPGTPKNLSFFGNPHLPSSGVNTQKQFQSELWIGNYFLGAGILRLRNTIKDRGNVKLIVNLEYTPGNLTKAQWAIPLNKLDLGGEDIPTIQQTSTYFFKKLWADIDLRPATNYLIQFVQILYGTTVKATSQPAAWGNGYQADDTIIKRVYSQLLEQLINDELTISADATAIAIKTESSQTDVKIRFNYGNSLGGTFNQTDVVVPQIQFTTINQTYYDGKINNSVYCLPEIKNVSFYTDTNKNFNGKINAQEGGKILLNSDRYNARFTVVPHIKVMWLMNKLAEYMNLAFEGSFLSNTDIQKLILHNLFATDKQATETSIPFNVHASRINYANHLPSRKLGEFLQDICNEFGVILEFNLLTQKVTFDFFNSILESSEFINFSGKLSASYESEVFDLSKNQLKWNTEAGDELYKDTEEQFKSYPTDDEVIADSDYSYEPYTCNFPSLYSLQQGFYSAHSAIVSLAGDGGSTGGGGETGGTGDVLIATFINPFVGVDKETATGTFSPHKFPDVTIPLYYEAEIDNYVPYFIITMNNDELSKFYGNNTTPYQKGIWSWRDNQLDQCTQYWDNCPGVSNQNFVSTLPYHERYDLMILPDFEPDGMNIVTYFTTKTTEECYNLGLSVGGSFGLGDSPDGFRTRRAIHENDVEISLVSGQDVEPCKKMSAFFAGISDRSLGYVFSEYTNPFQTFGYANYGRYPDSNGNFAPSFPRNDGSGLDWHIAPYWLNNFTLNGQPKHLKNYRYLYCIEETANHSEDSYPQGKLVYNPSNTYLRKVNHFGTSYDLTGENGYNVDHVLAKSMSNIETDVAYHEKNGKDSIHMFKIVCDRGEVWLWEDSKEFHDYGDRSVLALPRNVAFMGIMILFMSGSRGEQAWGTPQADSPGDGYNALFGASAVLHTPISIGGQNIVLASLRPNLTFHRWYSKQSYDNGTTWVQHKALEWRESEDYLPLRIATTASGYVVVFACRPYGVEPLTIKFKAEISNTKTYIGEITANDWKSCYPVEEPNRKDYFLKIYKV